MQIHTAVENAPVGLKGQEWHCEFNGSNTTVIAMMMILLGNYVLPTLIHSFTKGTHFIGTAAVLLPRSLDKFFLVFLPCVPCVISWLGGVRLTMMDILKGSMKWLGNYVDIITMSCTKKTTLNVLYVVVQWTVCTVCGCKNVYTYYMYVVECMWLQKWPGDDRQDCFWLIQSLTYDNPSHNLESILLTRLYWKQLWAIVFHVSVHFPIITSTNNQTKQLI